MKIFNALNTKIDGMRSKVVETKNGFLLNTNYYEQENLYPVPFENLGAYSSPYSLNIERILYARQYGWRRAENIIPQIEDLNNDIVFLRIFSGFISGDNKSFLWEVEEKDDLTINMRAIHDAGDIEFLQYCTQDNNYIYYLMRSNQTIYLYRYNKNNTTQSNMWSVGSDGYGYPNAVFLNEDANYIWIAYNLNQNYYFLRHRKSDGNNVVCNIYRGGPSQATAALYGSMQSDYTIDLGNGVYGIYQINLGNLEQPLDLYTVDTYGNFTTTYSSACAVEHCTITWNEDRTEIEYHPSDAQSIAHFYRTFKMEDNGITYLCLAVYEKNYANALYCKVQGVYVFEKTSNTEFTFISYNKIYENQQIGGLLLDQTKTYGIVPLNSSARLIKFDSTTKEWIPIGNEFTGIYSIGFDKFRRIWLQNLDASVEIFSFEDPRSVNIEFEKAFYMFEGQEIQTYIDFSASNYSGQDTNGRFSLVIEGSAKFAENNDVTLTFEYISGIKRIPIVINGIKPVVIYPTYEGQV